MLIGQGKEASEMSYEISWSLFSFGSSLMYIQNWISGKTIAAHLYSVHLNLDLCFLVDSQIASFTNNHFSTLCNKKNHGKKNIFLS